MTDDATGVCNLLSPLLGIGPAEVLDYPYALIGSIDAISDRLVDGASAMASVM